MSAILELSSVIRCRQRTFPGHVESCSPTGVVDVVVRGGAQSLAGIRRSAVRCMTRVVLLHAGEGCCHRRWVSMGVALAFGDRYDRSVVPGMGTRIPKMGTSHMHPTKVERSPTRNVADALFSRTQQRVLSLLFGQPERAFATSELIALAGSGSGAVQRELQRLLDCRRSEEHTS